jgi:membrane protein required for beta-lactamase induction
MIWWFLILGVSTLVVVCVAIALYVRLRRHLQLAHAARDGNSGEVEGERAAEHPTDIEH